MIAVSSDFDKLVMFSSKAAIENLFKILPQNEVFVKAIAVYLVSPKMYHIRRKTTVQMESPGCIDLHYLSKLYRTKNKRKHKHLKLHQSSQLFSYILVTGKVMRLFPPRRCSIQRHSIHQWRSSPMQKLLASFELALQRLHDNKQSFFHHIQPVCSRLCRHSLISHISRIDGSVQ